MQKGGELNDLRCSEHDANHLIVNRFVQFEKIQSNSKDIQNIPTSTMTDRVQDILKITNDCFLKHKHSFVSLVFLDLFYGIEAINLFTTSLVQN